QGQQEDPDPFHANIPIPDFSNENFVDAIIRFIVDDNQSLNVIENEHLRIIFLMLCKELKDSDIPHQSHLRARILETWKAHVKTLSSEMKVIFTICSIHPLLLKFIIQLGWITLDNASNNDTLMASLESKLQHQHIPFNKSTQRIRYF
ncbi:hypothetical protein BDQ12DRAFT_618437, partial [Crucibulum laeve]